MNRLPQPIKTVIALAIGFLVAWLFGQINAQLEAAEGPLHPAGLSVFGVPSFFFALYLLGGLPGQKESRRAEAGKQRAALSLQPPPGSAQVIVFRDGFVALTSGIDIGLDGRNVAQLTFYRFAAFEVTPGAHTVQVQLANGKAKSITFELTAGEVAAFRTGFAIGGLVLVRIPDPAAVVGKLRKRTMVIAEA